MDTFFPSSTPAMIEELQAQNDQSNRAIADLMSSLDKERVLIRSMEENVDSFIEALMRFAESGDIEDYVAEELADIFGRTLTRTVDVRMTIVLDAQVSVPVGYDLDDLHGDVDVEINPIYAADVQIDGIEVSTIDVEV